MFKNVTSNGFFFFLQKMMDRLKLGLINIICFVFTVSHI